jgi:hypothetical protein
MKKEETKEIKEEVKEEKKGYSVGEVVTQTSPAIINTDGKAMSQFEVLSEILNKLNKIERSIS